MSARALAVQPPLSGGLRAACKAAWLGRGFPASEPDAPGTARPYLTADLVRVIDAMARAAEREERLLRMHCGNMGLTLVHAARAGGLRDVRFLIASGAKTTYCDDYALCAAARGGHVDTMIALLDAGALGGRIAMLEVSKHGHVPAAALLVARGFYSSHLDKAWSQALITAARYGRLEMVAFLLDNGADLRAEGGQALVAARRFGQTAVEALLLERGA